MKPDDIKPRPDEPELEDEPLEESNENREIAGRQPNLGELDEDPDEIM